jgi:hypothetical protein
MALVLEECNTSELLGRNDAIKALMKENELLESKKSNLSTEVVELANLRLEVGGLRTEKEKVDKEVVELRKQAEDAKGAEVLMVEHALKANETSENLRLELDAEKRSSLALQQQVNLISTLLKAVVELALTTAQAYVAALGKFGGSTSTLPEEPSAFNLLS